jgi:hypothetical protein
MLKILTRLTNRSLGRVQERGRELVRGRVKIRNNTKRSLVLISLKKLIL